MTVSKLESSVPIKSSPDKFYGFFKNDMTNLAKVFPLGFKGAELVEGEEGKVGNVKLFSYIIGGITLSAKVKTEVIDDATKTLIFSVLEGDVLQLYKTFKVTLTVSEGSCKWSIEYEKVLIITPPPDLYMALAVATTGVVDLFVLSL